MAIIGILASITLPACQDYTIRSKVTEGLLIAGEAKAMIAADSATALTSTARGITAPVGTLLAKHAPSECR